MVQIYLLLSTANPRESLGTNMNNVWPRWLGSLVPGGQQISDNFSFFSLYKLFFSSLCLYYTTETNIVIYINRKHLFF